MNDAERQAHLADVMEALGKRGRYDNVKFTGTYGRPLPIIANLPKLERWLRGQSNVEFELFWASDGWHVEWQRIGKDRGYMLSSATGDSEQTARCDAALAAYRKLKEKA